MDRNKRSTIFGAALIILGILAGVWLGKGLAERHQTGQGPLLRLPQGGFFGPKETVSATLPDIPAGPAGPVGQAFTAADVRRIALRYGDDCSLRPNTASLLLRALDWDLSVDEPTVLIIHTHGSESFTKLPEQDYVQTTQYRTLNTAYNVVALGDRLAALLEQAGIGVLHDRALHDYPSYNDAYGNSRRSVQDYLRRYPSIRVVLDLHRDAVLNSDGSQYAPTVTAGGQRIARIMMVVGTNASGMYHPRWEENLAAALKLQALLERQVPNITRTTILRAQRFNHDLSGGAMIVEIGTAGNTLQEAMAAVPYLAQAIIELKHGATAGSTN